MIKGVTDTILMIRPKNFGSNPETLSDNHFQAEITSNEQNKVKDQAISEFDSMVSKLRDHDIEIIVIEDTDDIVRPDAIFPNNWFSTHTNGVVITYPMRSENRRIERREDIIDELKEQYNLSKRYGFEYLEDQEQYLEGTGSMVLDRVNKIVYAGLSHRTDIRVLEKFCVLLGYNKVIFHPFDDQGKSIYHTNVMMTMGDKYVILCTESITNDEERTELLAQLKSDNKDIIDISYEQMNAFAGNMLQLRTKLGEVVLVMSNSAYNSLTAEQIDRISAFNKIIQIPIPTIEKYGGGSVRCMIAEIFR